MLPKHPPAFAVNLLVYLQDQAQSQEVRRDPCQHFESERQLKDESACSIYGHQHEPLTLHLFIYNVTGGGLEDIPGQKKSRSRQGHLSVIGMIILLTQNEM